MATAHSTCTRPPHLPHPVRHDAHVHSPFATRALNRTTHQQKKKKKAVAVDLEEVETPTSETAPSTSAGEGTSSTTKASNVDALGNTKETEGEA